MSGRIPQTGTEEREKLELHSQGGDELRLLCGLGGGQVQSDFKGLAAISKAGHSNRCSDTEKEEEEKAGPGAGRVACPGVQAGQMCSVS